MVDASPLRGVLAIVHTPLTSTDEIDVESFRRQVDWAFDVGADGLGTGMVSEVLRLTVAERRQLTELLVEASRERGVVFASVGAESTRQAVENARHALAVGCRAVMAIPPVAAAIASSELLQYYCDIAEAIDIPVIVQDASGYVGQTIPLDVNLELLRRYGASRILFKPEASPIGPSLSRLRDATAGQAQIYEGSGGIMLIDCFRRGITGTMPGMDLLDGVVTMWRSLLDHDYDRAYRIYLPLCAVVMLQMQAGLDGFLAIEKYLMVKRGIFATDRRRHPFCWELDRETAEEVDRLFEMFQASLHAMG